MTHTIAIVEDEAIVAHSIEQKMRKLGYDVRGVFYHAEDLLPFLERERVHLILMDISLQNGMSGIEAAGLILNRYRIPVVYLTAFSDDATLEKAAKTEPYGYIIKPFNDRELKATVEMAIYKAESARELVYRQTRWEAMFFHIQDGLVVTNTKGVIISANPAMQHLTQLDESQMLGKSFDELFLFSHQAGKRENYALLSVRETGQSTPVYWDSSVMLDSHGQTLGTVYICRDISEMLTYEQALSQSESRYRSLVEDQTEWVVRIGEDGTILYANNAMSTAIGWEICQLIGQNFFDLMQMEQEAWREKFAQLSETNDTLSYESLYEHSGVRYVIEWRFRCVQLTKKGRVCQEIQGVGRDMTLIKEAEQALREEDELLKRILTAIEEGVVILNEEGAIEFSNPRGRDIIGIGKATGERLFDIAEIAHSSGERVEDFTSFLQQIVAMPAAAWVLKNRRHKTYELLVDVAALKREDKGKVQFVFLLTDLTLFNQLQQEFYRAQRLEAMEILSGGVAHDFNNILTVIMGNLSLLEMKYGYDNPDFLEHVKEAEQACARAKKLTQQMLSFSKGGTPIIRQENIVQMIEDTTRFLLQGSSIRWRIEKRVEIGFVPVDITQLTQVIQNIVLNAREAIHGSGDVIITLDKVSYHAIAGRVPEPLAGIVEYLEIIIEDTGPGISPDMISRIFDPYVSTKARGSGLGLAIAYTIVRKHRGLIQVQSEAGKGTIFSVYLPLYSTKDEGIQSPLGQKPYVPIKEQKNKIWILDDEVSIVRVLEKSLRQLGYSVESFHQVGSFVARLKDIAPHDLIIMDITMPGEMSAENRLEKICSTLPDVKILLISGYSKTSSLIQERTNITSLTKPFTIKELLHQVHTLLQPE